MECERCQCCHVECGSPLCAFCSQHIFLHRISLDDNLLLNVMVNEQMIAAYVPAHTHADARARVWVGVRCVIKYFRMNESAAIFSEPNIFLPLFSQLSTLPMHILHSLHAFSVIHIALIFIFAHRRKREKSQTSNIKTIAFFFSISIECKRILLERNPMEEKR